MCHLNNHYICAASKRGTDRDYTYMAIDPDEMVDMCFNFISYARKHGIKRVVFRPRKRALHDALRNSFKDQEYEIREMSVDYDKKGIYYPIMVDVEKSYFA